MPDQFIKNPPETLVKAVVIPSSSAEDLQQNNKDQSKEEIEKAKEDKLKEEENEHKGEAKEEIHTELFPKELEKQVSGGQSEGNPDVTKILPEEAKNTINQETKFPISTEDNQQEENSSDSNISPEDTKIKTQNRPEGELPFKESSTVNENKEEFAPENKVPEETTKCENKPELQKPASDKSSIQTNPIEKEIALPNEDPNIQNTEIEKEESVLPPEHESKNEEMLETEKVLSQEPVGEDNPEEPLPICKSEDKKVLQESEIKETKAEEKQFILEDNSPETKTNLDQMKIETKKELENNPNIEESNLQNQNNVEEEKTVAKEQPEKIESVEDEVITENIKHEPTMNNTEIKPGKEENKIEEVLIPSLKDDVDENPEVVQNNESSSENVVNKQYIVNFAPTQTEAKIEECFDKKEEKQNKLPSIGENPKESASLEEEDHKLEDRPKISDEKVEDISGGMLSEKMSEAKINEAPSDNVKQSELAIKPTKEESGIITDNKLEEEKVEFIQPQNEEKIADKVEDQSPEESLHSNKVNSLQQKSDPQIETPISESRKFEQTNSQKEEDDQKDIMPLVIPMKSSTKDPLQHEKNEENTPVKKEAHSSVPETINKDTTKQPIEKLDEPSVSSKLPSQPVDPNPTQNDSPINANKEEIPQEKEEEIDTSLHKKNEESLDLENKEDSIIITKKENEDDFIEAALIMGIEDEPEGKNNQQTEEEKEIDVKEDIPNPPTEENNSEEAREKSNEEKQDAETQKISNKTITKSPVEKNEDIPDNKEEIDIKQSEVEHPKESEKYHEMKNDGSEKMLLNNIDKPVEEIKQEQKIQLETSTNNKDDLSKEERVESESQQVIISPEEEEHKIEEGKSQNDLQEQVSDAPPNDLQEQVSDAPPNDLKEQVSDAPPNDLQEQVSDAPPNDLQEQVSDAPPNDLQEQVSDKLSEESKNEEKHSEEIITEEEKKPNNESTPSKLFQEDNVLMQTEKDRSLSEKNKNVSLIKEENEKEEKEDTEVNELPSDSQKIHEEKNMPSEIDKELTQEETKPIQEQTVGSPPLQKDQRSQTPDDIPELMSSGKLEIQFFHSK